MRRVPGGSPYVEPGIATTATILIAQGEFTAARRVLKEAETLAIPLNVGALHRTARFVSLQATLALEEDRAAEAEPLAKRAAELFHSDGYRDAEAAATELWARALRASGQSALADQAIVRAQSLAAKSEDVILRLTLSISAAVMTANSGAPGAGDSALRTLEGARREAAAIGYRHLELQAALAAAEIQMKSGRRSQAVERLVALEGEATKLGLGGIARKSSLLRASAAR
jgi:ATP/maltotriose-dependent transcriptional regulator MalT